MHADNFSFPAYLERIGFHGKPEADLATLRAMMRAQQFSVPFENLDVQAGKIVSLVPEHIVEKIVQRRRGGYCYEINGLFSMALTALGVPHRYLACRAMTTPERRPRTHMILHVSLEGRDWLVDLGFGRNGIRCPLPLDAIDVSAEFDGECYRLIRHAESGELVLQVKIAGDWSSLYGFDLSHQEWIDFSLANYYNSTHPDSVFVRQTVVVLHDEVGRKVLSGSTFKRIAHGQSSEREIGEGELASLLEREFGLLL